MKRLLGTEPRRAAPPPAWALQSKIEAKHGIVSRQLNLPGTCPAFQRLLLAYDDSQSGPSDDQLSRLICGSMNYRNEELLRYIVAHEHITELTIDTNEGLTIDTDTGLEPMDKDGWALLHDALPADFAVERLRLRNVLVNDPDAMQLMLRTLARMPHLTNLELLDVYGTEPCREGPGLTNLTSLSATFTKFSSEELKVDPILATILQISEPLEIRIRARDVYGTTLAEHHNIAQAIGASRCLESLTLHFSSGIRDAALRCYVEMLDARTSLRTFDLHSSTPISPHVFNALIEALSKHSQLEQISLLGCRASDHDQRIQLERLIGIQKLSRLELEDNGFIWADMKPMIEALSTNTNLRYLHGLELGARRRQYNALARALRQNNALESLSLAHVSDGSLSALAEAMQTNTALLHVDFLKGFNARAHAAKDSAGNMKAIQERVGENLRAWRIALAQGGMQMLLNADATLANRAGTIAVDHVGQDAARLALVNKRALENAQALMLRV